MRRQRIRKPATSISLFPFLAVLICTMGALIVLLVLMVYMARAQAETIAERRIQEEEARKTAERKKLLQDQEDYRWRQEILEQQRAELTKKVADRRLELSHLEDHIRRLEERWKQLQAEATEVERLRESDQQDQASIRSELARLQAEIAAERMKLEQARREVAKSQRSFTIIPYDGPQGTRRRPIYVECTESGIIIRPEGIVLSPEDFAGPLGPGNPLDAALRTIREHWARVGGDSGSGEPYPLLIVRPNGAVAYSMARGAMASWDDEFGYELIDADMVLDFPPSDPTLKRLLKATIATARQRQALLAAAMPSRFDGEAAERFVVSAAQERATPGGLAGRGKEGYGAMERRERRGSGNYTSAGFRSSSGRETAEPPAGMTGDGQGGASARQRAKANGRDGSAGGSAGAGGGAAHESVALSKGANWALPNVAAGSTGITRPIIVECHSDRLVILPDRDGVGRTQVIPVAGSVRGSIEQFVSGIWTHMELWGMAVAGGYWKPVLKIWVAPDAESRFGELQVLLKDSGIDAERR